MHAVGSGLSGFAAQFIDESALEMCIHVMRCTNRCLYLYLLRDFLGVKVGVWVFVKNYCFPTAVVFFDVVM